MLVIVRQVRSSSTFGDTICICRKSFHFFPHVNLKKKVKHTRGFILLEGTKLLLGCVVAHMHINPKNFEVLF